MVRYLLRYPLLRPLPNSKEQLESTPTPKKKQRKEQKKNSTGMGTDHMGDSFNRSSLIYIACHGRKFI
jgi:hypothetical protein